jgi:hypothetical protein
MAINQRLVIAIHHRHSLPPALGHRLVQKQQGGTKGPHHD